MNIITTSLDKEKAEDIALFDLRDKSPLGDYMIIATGRSSTHIKALAGKLEEACKKSGITDIRVEGKEQGDWVVFDVGDVIVHLFRGEVREFYDIDKLWMECVMENAAAHLKVLV